MPEVRSKIDPSKISQFLSLLLRRMLFCSTALLVCAGMSLPIAIACDCAGPEPPEVEFKQSDVVFTGRVRDITIQKSTFGWIMRGTNPEVVTFVVNRGWKGVETPIISVWTHQQTATCGYPFELQKEYLVYAHVSRSSERRGLPNLSTNYCTRTKLIDKAGEDLQVLEK